MSEPIVLESNQNHATITDSGICPTLPSSMGMGGGYVPMIVEIHESNFDRQMESDMSRRSDVDSPNIRGNRRR